ncbi:MAG: amino acid adenylation domain-containing protein, partial [bacterium]|nr:amino acid adenylation domain-containing protein [bacterium]
MSNQHFQKNVLSGAGKYSNERDYWMNKLSGEITLSHFPYDNYDALGPAEEQGSPDFPGLDASQTFQVAGQLYDKLMNVSNRSDTRLFILLATGLFLLLHKYTGNEEIIIGAPIDRQETEGDLVNTVLALKNQTTPEMTFKELLYQARQTIVEASQNLNYPLESIANELFPGIGQDDRFPLFDVALLLHNIHEKSYLKHIKINMIISFLSASQSLEGEIRYNSAAYDKGTVQRVIRHYTHLLEAAFADVNSPLVDIGIMTGGEKERLMVELNDTAAQFPENKSIYRLFEEQAQKTPAAPAVIDAGDDGALTYKELNEKTNQLSRLLIGKGAGAGSIIGIMGERKIDIVIGILAILKTGAAYLPLDAQNPDERLRFILSDSRTRLILSQQDVIHRRQEVFGQFPSGNVIDLDDEAMYRGDTRNPGVSFRSTGAAYIIYTSGTTGKPKGVLVTHRSLVNYIHWAVKSYVKGETLNFPLYTSIGFDLTVTSIFVPIVTGGAVVVYSGWAGGNLIERIVDENRVGIVKLTPSHLQLIRDKKIKNSHCNIKRFIVGGEVLEYRLARTISDNFNGDIEIYNEYGPTEATVGCMIYKFDPGKNGRGSVPIGGPADNTQIYLLDKHYGFVPDGAVGELYISGTGLAHGYLNRQLLTAEKFAHDLKGFRDLQDDHDFKKAKKEPSAKSTIKLYKTGDLARRLADGNIEFLGRIDHQVKIRGFRIELGEIESKLLEHDPVDEAVVTTRKKNSPTADNGGTQDRFLCAYIVPAKGEAVPVEGEAVPDEAEDAADDPLSATSMREYLARKLPDYMVPVFFMKLDFIPLTHNGKVDLNALPQPEIKTESGYAAPRNPMEDQLVGIWANVLGLDKESIGIDGNFFELGGHSLAATILLARIQKEADIKLSLIDIFNYPDVRALSQYVENLGQHIFEGIQPAEEREYYVLTPPQHRLYFLQRLEEGGVGYNMPIVLELEGELDTAQLERVFTALTERHESFRTSFELVEETPYQRIHKDPPFKLEYYHVPPGSDTDFTDEKVKGFVRPFQLDRAPLLRVGLVRIAPREHVLMLDMHHIISDGVSIVTFVKECMALYSGEQLPPLNIQYKDYSQWHYDKKESIERQQDYWHEEFSGEIPVLSLPLDFPRPELQSFEGDSSHFYMGGQTFRPLKFFALEEGATVFMAVLTVLNIMLSKCSGQERIIVGTETAGRAHADLENVVGMFVNTLAIQNSPQGEKTSREFLREVREKALNAFENQDYQFGDLVNHVAVARDVSRNPLFDVMFSLDNISVKPGEIPRIKIPQLKMKPYKRKGMVAKFDLTLNGTEAADELFLSFEYCTRLFKEETIRRFINYFNTVAAAVLENPDGKISGISIITPEEKKQVLFEFNTASQAPVPQKSYARLFEEQAARTPANVAVTFGGQQVTYEKLNEEANRLAHYLIANGVTPGAMVSLYLRRSIAMLASMIGIFKAGAAYIPIEVDYPSQRVDYILENSQTRLVITETPYDENLSNSHAPSSPSPDVLRLRPQREIKHSIGRQSGQNPGTHVGPDAIAYMIYTSGTTGKPKGVMIHQQGMVNHLYAMIDDLSITSRDIVAQTASACFDISVWQFFSGLLTGSVVAIIEKETVMQPRSFLTRLQGRKVTILESVPSLLTVFLEAIADEEDKALHQLRWMALIGEPLTPPLAGEWYRQYPRIKLLNAYGPTEASDSVSHYVVDGPPSPRQTSVSIGKPVQNLHIYVLDKHRALCPVGVRGEICIAGVGVGKGYWQDEEKTRRAFIPNPYVDEIGDRQYARLYKTGDIGYFREDGNLECLGRLDFQVKIRGNRIELGEIERHLLEHEDVSEAVVVAREGEKAEKYLCAYIVPVPDPSEDFKVPDLRDYLDANLPAYMVPAYFVQLDIMPLTNAGKIDRNALPDPDKTAPDPGRDYRAPLDEVQETVARIWQDVIGVQTIGIDDGFFQLGGDSIKAIRISARLQKFNLKLNIADLFRYPTIAELSGHLKPIKERAFQGIV